LALKQLTGNRSTPSFGFQHVGKPAIIAACCVQKLHAAIVKKRRFNHVTLTFDLNALVSMHAGVGNGMKMR